MFRTTIIAVLSGAVLTLSDGAPAHAQSAEGLLRDVVRGVVGAQTSRRNDQAANLNRSQRVRVQRMLNRLGYKVGPEDGIFGPTTKRKIAGWQRDNGHRPTGTLTVGEYKQMTGTNCGGAAASASGAAVSGNMAAGSN